MRRFGDVPMYLNILAIFLIICACLVSSLLYLNYSQNKAAALAAADKLLIEVGGNAYSKTQSVYEPAFQMVAALSRSPGLTARVDSPLNPTTNVFVQVLRDNRSLTSLYIGCKDGSFFFVTRLMDRPLAAKKLNAPANAAFAVNMIRERGSEKRSTRWFYDKDLGFLSMREEGVSSYDPRKRPWYKLASGKGETVMSKVYMFSSTNEPGITVARQMRGGKGVLGADVALSSFLNFFRKQFEEESALLFVFNRRGEIMHTDLDRLVKRVTNGAESTVDLYSVRELGDPVIARTFQEFETNRKQPFESRVFSVAGTDYIARTQAMTLRGDRERFLAVVVPLKRFTEPIKAAGRLAGYASMGVIVLFIPIVYIVSRRISRPLQLLESEANRVGDFNLDGHVDVPSRVLEIRNLSEAMDTMLHALQGFVRYVPRTLVERMVRLGITPELGGTRRDLTVFFSDVVGFTTLAEGMSPESLTNHVSEYFEVVGSEILAGEGSIDKFIGDAVMAFWNAPDLIDEHPKKACLAALRCQAAIRELNASFAEQGKPEMLTRIGLHTGETVVGNVGSSDRMDYTAMGATVNTASRLEGLNKYLGTSILVSRETMAQAGDGFVFRFVGRVVVKGGSVPVAVYELMGLVPGEDEKLSVTNEQVAYRDAFEKGLNLYFEREFLLAEQIFADLCAANPDDLSTARYRQLASQFTAAPPAEDWQGVETFTEK